ncbi:hypothetical protein BDK51DRAFT_32798 [Blyttiomyces helicus]|uniref:FAD-binding domain-containing protein n=1 Tax=Blyttiomyces helicus TaxID=388810 RepID=A0A4P9W9B0_9FUNG|nr:hypothetical protein BDK51DRAFT_32798 [Blyttiomyces helicus]|eukprot:RKO87698.1 hypothetical protein BDK51DRAFT_32798 [Blyttiomyces helicus]
MYMVAFCMRRRRSREKRNRGLRSRGITPPSFWSRSCLPTGISWDHKLRTASRPTNPVISLNFGPEGVATFDLIVGADGAWSKVTAKYQHLAELVGPGTFCALARRNGVTAQRGVQDSVLIYIAVHRPGEERWDAVARGTAAEAKVTFLRDESIFAGAKVDTRPLHTLPVGHRWAHVVDATVIGDAAHLMRPNGQGDNLAIRDALDLSQVVGPDGGERGRGWISCCVGAALEGV